MQQCPACAHENQSASLYCENCGSPLKISSTTTNGGAEYYTIPSTHIAPPPPLPDTPPSPYLNQQATVAPSPAYTYHYLANENVPQTRTVGHIVLSVLLYLLGAGSTSLGTFGIWQGSIGDSWAAVGLLSVLLISLIVMVIVLVRHRQPHLRWWHRLLWWTCLSVGALILLVICYTILDTQAHGNMPATTEDLFFGSSLIFYGLFVMLLALW